MRKTICLALLAAGIFSTGAAFAQTCTAPGAWTPSADGTPPLAPNLCTGSDSVAQYCDILDSSGKNDAVYQVTFAAGYTAQTIIVGGAGAGFNPVAYLYTAGCTTGSGCVQTGDPSAAMPLTGLAPGNYFLAVSAASSDAAGACGTPSLTTNGTFPVALQNFSVE